MAKRPKKYEGLVSIIRLCWSTEQMLIFEFTRPIVCCLVDNYVFFEEVRMKFMFRRLMSGSTKFSVYCFKRVTPEPTLARGFARARAGSWSSSPISKWHEWFLSSSQSRLRPIRAQSRKSSNYSMSSRARSEGASDQRRFFLLKRCLAFEMWLSVLLLCINLSWTGTHVHLPLRRWIQLMLKYYYILWKRLTRSDANSASKGNLSVSHLSIVLRGFDVSCFISFPQRWWIDSLKLVSKSQGTIAGVV